MVMVMAGGTGGHVMPALAAAKQLQARGIDVRWMGNADSMESRVAEQAAIAFDVIRIKGLRQSGLKRKLMMPAMLLGACGQAWRTIRRRRPDVLLGMGGFVSGPGGLVARLTGTPLVLHEQNAVAGLTNKHLARLASSVLSGFPAPQQLGDAEFIGNPVREEIAAIEAPEQRMANRQGFRILIVGGSQGAQSFNDQLPARLAASGIENLEIWHQCGRGREGRVREAYAELGCKARTTEFIDDMAEAYRWSDLVICRAGAMTVAEVSAAGVAALFVPYPYAVNDHQALNAGWLTDADAALMFRQDAFEAGEWLDGVRELSRDRKALIAMACRAREMAKTDAAEKLADACEAMIHA